jgi:hypothetical protein
VEVVVVFHLQVQEELQVLEVVQVQKVMQLHGANGGSGVVILSMPLANFSNTTTGSPTESDDGTTKVLIFTASGSYTG